MELTRTIPLKNGKYVVEFLINLKYLERSLSRILQYHCKSSKNYQATFETNNGDRHLTIAVDYLLYGSISNGISYYLLRNNVTGVVVENIEEAHAVEEVIEKGHMWDLLKE